MLEKDYKICKENFNTKNHLHEVELYFNHVASAIVAPINLQQLASPKCNLSQSNNSIKILILVVQQ